MGIIERQSIKGSLVNYLGVFIGFFATLFIYPLDWELYGTIQYWISSAVILTPILRQGSTALLNKFYPHFKKKEIRGLLGLVLIISTFTIMAMSLLLFLLIFIFRDFSFIQQMNIQSQSVVYIYLLAVVMIYFSIFQLHAANVRRIVVPEIISKVGFKLFLILLIVSSYFGILDNQWVGVLLVLFYLLACVTMYFYLIILGGLDLSGWTWRKLPPTLKKKMVSFWFFGGLNYLGVLLAYKIDLFMIGTFVDKTSVGYYSIFLFMVNLMIIPMTSINQIAGPIVSESFENNDISKIEQIYKKSSNTIFSFGTLVIIIIWMNIFFLLDIMRNGEDLIPYVSVILFLGLAKVFDLLTSINNLIIIYSRWYQLNLVFLAIMSVINILLNFYFIDAYGIIGASYATSISLFIFNGIKSLFIYIKFGIHPFSKHTIYIILMLAAGIFTASTLQDHPIVNNILSMIIYSSLTAIIYTYFNYKLGTSLELNQWIDKRILRK